MPALFVDSEAGTASHVCPFFSFLFCRCMCTDELILPLCQHLAPRLSDALVLGVLGTAAKRLEASLKRVRCLLVHSRHNPPNRILTLCFALVFGDSVVSQHWVP
jgi:hypothetical protein